MPQPIEWRAPSRAQMLDALKNGKSFLPSDDTDEYDLVVIGGGATGTGVLLDAVTRGLKVALVERDDYASGTSSKSTKLVHGGVRYLEKAVLQLDHEQYKMVKEALHERRIFLKIAPYLSEPLPIMLPVYTWWQIPYFFAGMKMYDLLAGSQNMSGSYVMTRKATLESWPLLKDDGLTGSVVYYDGQQNDARMNVVIALTAIHHGAVSANHTEVVAVHKKPVPGKKEDQIRGVRMRDRFTGEEWDVKCKGVVNATGPFSDAIRKLDVPSTAEIVQPASGVHITLPDYFSPRGRGLLDARTSDGRVIFFLPWQGRTIAGTTDHPDPIEQNPIPSEDEISFILGEVQKYIAPGYQLSREHVRSAWKGLRPLVKDPDATDTQSLVRNHMINVSASGLLTIAGGKWTTYREMAQQTVDRAVQEFGLENKAKSCQTEDTRLLGAHLWHPTLYVNLIQRYNIDTDVAQYLAQNYGDRAFSLLEQATQDCLRARSAGELRRWQVGPQRARLDPHFPVTEAEVSYACRNEYAQTATDFLARRSRLSFLDVDAATAALPRVVAIMAKELNWNEERKNTELHKGVLFMHSMGLPKETVDALKDLDGEGIRQYWEFRRL